jgi:hypothetical protein
MTTGGGVYRGPVPANPCQSEDDAYQGAINKQKETQRQLNWVNSHENERAVKASKSKKAIREWEASVKKATKANNDAATAVGKAQRKLQDCTKKHSTGMGQPR